MTKKSLATALMCSMTSLCIIFSGCSLFSETEKDPVGIIQKAYGDEQFTISFSSEGLDSPLSDVYYTASNIPTLPTPEKVGYIFTGWYFDSQCTQPYDDELLLIKMTDVTLYAKWTEETFTANGTYGIEFEARLLEDTVKKGELTDEYGGYEDFSKAIISDETYIEKSESGIQLKLQYDTGVNVPFASTSVYTVSVASESANSASVAERITAETDTKKTVFINLDKFKLSDTLYLSISWLNYTAQGLTDAERERTQTTYTVAFEITRFIGYDRPFADTDSVLDDGYYLARSYFTLTDGEETMMESFNPVYSYVYAENGNYTLIKPFAAYAITKITTGGAIEERDLYSRAINYYKVLACYDAAVPEGDLGTDSSMANQVENWDLGRYRTVSYEFHAETSQIFYIIDYGTDITRELVFQSASTSMESFGMGLTGKRLTLDYEHLIPLDEDSVDYTPLTGDSFMYADTVQTYGYGKADFTAGETMLNLVYEYGMNTDLITFFFSAAAQNVNLDTIGSKVYNSRITYTPVSLAANAKVSDMRYEIAEFNMTAEVFGYDASSCNLCKDMMNIQNFDGGAGVRNRSALKVGESLAVDTAVSMETLFRKKVDPYNTDFGLVRWQAYEMSGGSVDFGAPITLSRTFTFTRDVAILFTADYEDGVVTSLVELRTATEPIVTVVDGTYSSDLTYEVGKTYTLPRIEYEWYGRSENYLYNWFPDNRDYKTDVSVMSVALFSVDGSGTYSLSYRAPDSECGVFKMNEKHMFVVYEIENDYGERLYYAFEFIAKDDSPVYEISDQNGNVLTSGDVTYTTDSAGTSRKKISYNAEDMFIDELDSVYLQLQKTYSIGLSMEEGRLDMPLVVCTVYAYEYAGEIEAAGKSAEEIYADISKWIGDGYAYIKLAYETGYGDTVTQVFLYNVTFNGRDGYEYIASYENYFTETEYAFTAPQTLSPDGMCIAQGSLTFEYSSNGSTYQSVASVAARGSATVSSLGNSYSVVFHKTGSFRIGYSIHIRYYENGDAVFADRSGVTVKFYIYIDVDNVNDDLNITYVTDAAHPFNDDIQPFATALSDENGNIVAYSYTPGQFSLTDGKPITLNSSSFAPAADGMKFYAWGITADTSYGDSNRIYIAGAVISDFIGSFNSRFVTLYALWDSGITVTAIAGDQVATKTVYVSQRYSSSTEFYYNVKLEEFGFPEVAGYVHAGWSVTLKGENKIYEDDDFFLAAGDVVITSVYKKLLTLVYKTDNPYTDIEESYINISRSVNIVEGSVLSEALTTAKLNQLSSVAVTNSAIADTYEFKYWAVEIDGELVAVDLYSTEIDGDWAEESDAGFTVTLIAVYGEKEA